MQKIYPQLEKVSANALMGQGVWINEKMRVHFLEKKGGLTILISHYRKVYEDVALPSMMQLENFLKKEEQKTVTSFLNSLWIASVYADGGLPDIPGIPPGTIPTNIPGIGGACMDCSKKMDMSCMTDLVECSAKEAGLDIEETKERIFREADRFNDSLEAFRNPKTVAILAAAGVIGGLAARFAVDMIGKAGFALFETLKELATQAKREENILAIFKKAQEQYVEYAKHIHDLELTLDYNLSLQKMLKHTKLTRMKLIVWHEERSIKAKRKKDQLNGFPVVEKCEDYYASEIRRLEKDIQWRMDIVRGLQEFPEENFCDTIEKRFAAYVQAEVEKHNLELRLLHGEEVWKKQQANTFQENAQIAGEIRDFERTKKFRDDAIRTIDNTHQQKLMELEKREKKKREQFIAACSREFKTKNDYRVFGPVRKNRASKQCSIKYEASEEKAHFEVAKIQLEDLILQQKAAVKSKAIGYERIESNTKLETLGIQSHNSSFNSIAKEHLCDQEIKEFCSDQNLSRAVLQKIEARKINIREACPNLKLF